MKATFKELHDYFSLFIDYSSRVSEKPFSYRKILYSKSYENIRKKSRLNSDICYFCFINGIMQVFIQGKCILSIWFSKYDIMISPNTTILRQEVFLDQFILFQFSERVESIHNYII